MTIALLSPVTQDTIWAILERRSAPVMRPSTLPELWRRSRLRNGSSPGATVFVAEYDGETARRATFAPIKRVAAILCATAV